MVNLNLKSLVGKLNDVSRRALESAAGLCLSRTNYNVEVEHWLLKLMETANSDVDVLFRHYGINLSRVTPGLTRAIDQLKTGNARPPGLSPDIVDLTREAWVLASVEFGGTRVRSGHLLCALLSDTALSRTAYEASREFEKIPVETLRKELPNLLGGSIEEGDGDVAEGPAAAVSAEGRPIRPGGSKSPALDQFTIDLTRQAAEGKIDPVLGRDPEIRQLVDILMRRRQNNPILTGEAGVGKTAVVEGFALRIAAKDVPKALHDVSVRSLDLGLLQAGAGIKGEFENRLKSVIDEVKSSPRPIILFIDEAHTMIGAGGQAGQNDAANLLKPALARGELRTIAATTWAEYKKFFEKDAALTRRFQVVKVEEPTESVCVEMMRGLVGTLEKHHKIRILEDAVVDAVKLSSRYISGRQLPDKAVSLLDTSAARVALGQTAVPACVEDCRRRISQLATAIDICRREQETGGDRQERIDSMEGARAQAEEELQALEKRWKREQELVSQICQVRARLEGRSEPEPASVSQESGLKAGDKAQPIKLTEAERKQLRDKLEGLSTELAQMQGDQPLVHAHVDSQIVGEVVAGWTGIPVGRMMADEIRTVLSLETKLNERVIGQTHATKAISDRLPAARAGLTDPNRPIGAFLLAGPSGVGKTETALALADLLYGGDQNMTVINMSEFKEEHKVSLLMGAPPGYVGYGEGGVLTEAVRRRPYSVVLLDEMEKAHPGVQEIFYQVFDKGSMRDGEGRDIDFRNTVILMTSNAGSDLVMKLCADLETRPTPDGLTKALHEELVKTVFKPAFLGRVTLVPYYPLTDESLRRILEIQLGRIARRLKENHRATLVYDAELLQAIASRCTEVETGARNIDHILTRNLLPELSAGVLGRMADGAAFETVRISLKPDWQFECQFS